MNLSVFVRQGNYLYNGEVYALVEVWKTSHTDTLCDRLWQTPE